jgi:hypothetical protein
MLIDEKALRHWVDNFYGYGSWDARIWFVEYEEGGGDTPEEVAEKFNYFHQLAASKTSLCDIREMYAKVGFRSDGPKANLFANLQEYRFGARSMPHGVWKNLIAFVHGFRKKKLPDLLSYQRKSFATAAGRNEALISLYPLPSPHNHAWYYSWLDMPRLGFLKTRALYEEFMFGKRISTIVGNIKTHKPEVVLMYGMNNINTLKQSFPGAEFKLFKATKLEIPQHHRADLDGTRVIITTQVPALRHNRIETGFDWEEFGKIVRS